ncbi:MAG TPA: hypothetical protein VLA62_12770, partial [Solirubrobacterales bacterium]|nr:hypothetical protein [Solirubrobacterales bacterium]
MRNAPAAIAAILLGALAAGGCGGVGEPKPGAPAHHRERGFQNLNPEFTRPPFWPRLAWVWSRMLRTTFQPRSLDLPRAAADGADPSSPPGPTVTWVGHATFLVQLDGVNLLTDPTWSDR